MKEHLPWLVPLLLVLFSGGAQIYELVGQVDVIKTKQEKVTADYIDRIHNLEFRLDVLERFCCKDKISDETTDYSSVATTGE